jgi:transcriptional regulator with GAF, ATPase, and Fis domain
MNQINTSSELLLNLAMMLGQADDYDEVLRLVTRQTALLLRTDTTLLSMINPNTRQTIKTICAEGRSEPRRGMHTLNTVISGWVINHNSVFLSSNIKNDPRLRSEISRHAKDHAVLAVPLMTEGITIGSILVMIASSKRIFTEKDQKLLEQLAILVAPYLKNLQKLQQYFQAPLPQQVLLDKYKEMGLIGKSPAFVELLKSIEAASRCEVRVLLEGDSGTGKELVARAIHQLSSRSNRAFITVDCAVIPANLIESELFGHLKGAFTGAVSDRRGLIEEADGSTLFIDEISNLPLDLQAKLLRMLQEGEIRPLGSNITKRVDVRIIAASSMSLKQKMEKMLFREDLYYRLHVYPIKIPALKQRVEDIGILAKYFLDVFSSEQHKALEQIHEEILDFMLSRRWPGNVRELENFIERLVTLTPAEAKVLMPEILPSEFKKEWTKIKQGKVARTVEKALPDQVADFEEQIIRQALENNDWNQSRAARELHISEQTIRYKMNKLGIVNLR